MALNIVLSSSPSTGAVGEYPGRFVHLGQLLVGHAGLVRKVEALERKVGKHDHDLQRILVMLGKLLELPQDPPRPDTTEYYALLPLATVLARSCFEGEWRVEYSCPTYN